MTGNGAWYGNKRRTGNAPERNQVRRRRQQPDVVVTELPRTPLTGRLAQDLGLLRQILEPCGDMVFREFAAAPPIQAAAALVYCRNLVDKTALSDFVLRQLMTEVSDLRAASKPARPLVQGAGVAITDLDEARDLADVVAKVLRGQTALLLDGMPLALMVKAVAYDGREVAEPITEGVVRGPREGFVEILNINLGLLRRRLQTQRFRIAELQIGELSKTRTAILYIDGLADNGVVTEARRRLAEIRIDAVIDSGYLEEMIEDHPWSTFPQMEHSERPDKVAAALLEGRIAILAEGSPFALLAPSTFGNFLQSSEDYYERFLYGSLVRWLRFFALALALTGPSLYIALTTMHQEMLPIDLAVRIAGAREGVPFPAFVEVFLMEVVFEVLREAGIRLPRPVGQAVSIIGGLVIGEAAVQAGLAAPPTIVAVATTGIASFALPAFNFAIALRMLRFPMMMIAATFGLPGITVFLMVILTHAAALRSFGVPYLSPFGPARPDEWKDVLVRAPWWALLRRPRTGGHSLRIPPGQRPAPPAGGGGR